MPVHEPRWGGRVVECTGLENRRGLRVTAGSNPAPTAWPRESWYGAGTEARGLLKIPLAGFEPAAAAELDAGPYSVRIQMREVNAAVDKVVFQLAPIDGPQAVGASIPEPGTLTLAAVSLMCLLRRRSRDLAPAPDRRSFAQPGLYSKSGMALNRWARSFSAWLLSASSRRSSGSVPIPPESSTGFVGRSPGATT